MTAEPHSLSALKKRKGMRYWGKKWEVEVRGDSLDDYVDVGEVLGQTATDAEIRFMAEVLPWEVHSMPFGGPRWPQREGFEILTEIIRSTKAAIRAELE